MTKRLHLTLAALAVLGACTPPIYQQQSADPFASPRPVMAGQEAAAIPPSELNSALFGTPNGPATGAVNPAPGLQSGAAPSPTAGQATDPAAAGTNHAGISDEQDFQAVSSRETIESDKARIEANRAQYQQIAPTALPQRAASEQVSSVVAYALNAPNRLGEQIYSRWSVDPAKHEAACASYPTDEAAQEAFLKAGGPKRDPKKLDPDGDGFACKFDPTPFQKAR